ncbi:MAG TPA: SPFH domain-containing protein [Pedobacter sp.]|uniref:SPFH domain-containing protein n=1 Tax=Pedobacter sp. TaxID=1411316 RepID=UPI002CC393EF|nr:SPFH domain-containing protein [Pedobacter sp.]HMI01835.1 SPFH domain-containing protein [Pedobacter sp.]
MGSIKEFLEYILNAIKIWIIIQPWEKGLRVRMGKSITKLNGGIYFRIPYLDSVFIQSVRLRVVSMPMQTLTSKDLQTVTLNSAMGYSICNIEKMYSKLFHPELTLSNMAMSEISDFVYKNDMTDLDPHLIEQAVIKKLSADDYGINVEYFRLTNFAVVRTFRLIQDHSWVGEGISLDVKK